MAEFRFPPIAGDRGPGFWSRPANLMASRNKFLRLDYSNEWRYSFGQPNPPDRSVPFSALLQPGRSRDGSFRFIVLGDTGEGDYSQYGLLPLIRGLKPDFIIINGDVAYPAGRTGTEKRDQDDFLVGFFEPYRNMHCPVWATPGNHEYYSGGNGREFYDIFCTRKYDQRWADHGLRHETLQPGTYWELADPDGPSKLVVIGIDSGKSANLDGKNDWWQVWKRKIYPDDTQHLWLDERLRRAKSAKKKVIVLFHIPALVRGSHKEENLNTLHRVIAEHDCVRLVLCGHEHNHQDYSAATFLRYLEKEQTGRPFDRPVVPRYIVSGGGGAYLQSTDFADGPYPCDVRYPSKEWWKGEVPAIRRIVGVGRDKSMVSRGVSSLLDDATRDEDVPKKLSLILVEVKPSTPAGGKLETWVTPVFLEHLKDLYTSKDVVVDVQAGNPPVGDAELKACLQSKYRFRL